MGLFDEISEFFDESGVEDAVGDFGDLFGLGGSKTPKFNQITPQPTAEDKLPNRDQVITQVLTDQLKALERKKGMFGGMTTSDQNPSTVTSTLFGL